MLSFNLVQSPADLWNGKDFPLFQLPSTSTDKLADLLLTQPNFALTPDFFSSTPSSLSTSPAQSTNEYFTLDSLQNNGGFDFSLPATEPAIDWDQIIRSSLSPEPALLQAVPAQQQLSARSSCSSLAVSSQGESSEMDGIFVMDWSTSEVAKEAGEKPDFGLEGVSWFNA